MTAKRISRQRLERLRQSLSGRDENVLSSVRLYRLMELKHIVRLHFTGHASDEAAATVCRRVLRRLRRLGLVRRLDRRVGGVRAGSAGYIYQLSPTGARLFDPNKRHRTNEPGASHVKHRLAITELGTLVTAQCVELGLDYHSVKPEPFCWQNWNDGYRTQTLKPDLRIHLMDERTEASWFVEIDLATESVPVLQRKCEMYTRYWQSGSTTTPTNSSPKSCGSYPPIAAPTSWPDSSPPGPRPSNQTSSKSRPWTTPSTSSPTCETTAPKPAVAHRIKINLNRNHPYDRRNH